MMFERPKAASEHSPADDDWEEILADLYTFRHSSEQRQCST
jgi:hypothetical protein